VFCGSNKLFLRLTWRVGCYKTTKNDNDTNPKLQRVATGSSSITTAANGVLRYGGWGLFIGLISILPLLILEWIIIAFEDRFRVFSLGLGFLLISPLWGLVIIIVVGGVCYCFEYAISLTIFEQKTWVGVLESWKLAFTESQWKFFLRSMAITLLISGAIQLVVKRSVIWANQNSLQITSPVTADAMGSLLGSTFMVVIFLSMTTYLWAYQFLHLRGYTSEQHLEATLQKRAVPSPVSGVQLKKNDFDPTDVYGIGRHVKPPLLKHAEHEEPVVISVEDLEPRTSPAGSDMTRFNCTNCGRTLDVQSTKLPGIHPCPSCSYKLELPSV